MTAREKELFEALAELMNWLQPWVEDYERDEPQSQAYDRAAAVLAKARKARPMTERAREIAKDIRVELMGMAFIDAGDELLLPAGHLAVMEKHISAALQSEREAAAAEARRAAIKEMIAECDRIRASYPTERNGAYRPANAQAGWDEACLRLRATCIALALPAPQETP